MSELPSETIVYLQVSLDEPLGRAGLALRRRVFEGEQGVPAEVVVNADDERALHAIAYDEADGSVVGTLRLVPRGDACKAGRVAIDPSRRGQGIGAALMRFAADLARKLGYAQLVLNAQMSAMGFYERLGYRAEGDTIAEAGIEHQPMTLEL